MPFSQGRLCGSLADGPSPFKILEIGYVNQIPWPLVFAGSGSIDCPEFAGANEGDNFLYGYTPQSSNFGWREFCFSIVAVFISSSPVYWLTCHYNQV